MPNISPSHSYVLFTIFIIFYYFLLFVICFIFRKASGIGKIAIEGRRQPDSVMKTVKQEMKTKEFYSPALIKSKYFIDEKLFVFETTIKMLQKRSELAIDKKYIPFFLFNLSYLPWPSFLPSNRLEKLKTVRKEYGVT